MLLKCKYLAQFSVSELAKNSINMANAEARCPFLSFARSSLHTDAVETNKNLQDESKIINFLKYLLRGLYIYLLNIFFL